MSQSRIKTLIISVLVIAAIVVIAAIYFKPKQALPKQVKIDTTNQPTMGNPKAKVQIVAFEDLKCPNCMRFNRTLFPQIKAKYINSGKVKYTMINLAFIDGSMPAANAARCLYEQDKQFFFPFVKYVYEHQPPEEENWATIPTLVRFASNIPGIDKKKLAQCIVNSPYTNLINNNMKIASKAMNGEVATPTLYVNGRIVRPLTMEHLKTLIDAAS